MSPDGISIDEVQAELVLSKAQAGKRARSRAVAAPPSTGPCVGCRNEQRCQTESLACSALVLFRQIGASPARLACAPRFPSEALYERAMEPIEIKATPAQIPQTYRRRRAKQPEVEASDHIDTDTPGADLSSALWDDL